MLLLPQSPRRRRCSPTALRPGIFLQNQPVRETGQLRKALSLLARALPDAEARLVAATARWTPETASACEALHREVKLLRSELIRIATELEALLEQQGPRG